MSNEVFWTICIFGTNSTRFYILNSKLLKIKKISLKRLFFLYIYYYKIYI